MANKNLTVAKNTVTISEYEYKQLKKKAKEWNYYCKDGSFERDNVMQIFVYTDRYMYLQT